MNRIYEEDNYIIVDRSINPPSVFPKNNSEYDEYDDQFDLLKFPNKKPIIIPFSEINANLWFEKDGTTPHTVEGLRSFFRQQTGFNTASGGSGATNVPITQSVDGFSLFVDGVNVGDIGYARNSEGIRWLPGTIGGTYYPSGFYVWDGTNWVSDRNAIVNQLEQNVINITSNDGDILALQNSKANQTELDQEGFDRAAADQLLSIGISDNTANLVSESNTRLNEDMTLQSNIDDEEEARQNADTNLQSEINQEAINRANADSALNDKIEEYTREFICSTDLGLINQTVAFEPLFVRETIPNVSADGTWSVLIPESGDFTFHTSFGFSYNSSTSDFLSHILFNGTDIEIPLHIEPKDIQGGGVQLPTVAGGVVSTGTITSGNNQFLLASGDKFLSNLTAGDVVTFKLEFACGVVNQEATIFGAYMSLRRVINSNV